MCFYGYYSFISWFVKNVQNFRLRNNLLLYIRSLYFYVKYYILKKFPEYFMYLSLNC